jgi:hypothetical protein
MPSSEIRISPLSPKIRHHGSGAKNVSAFMASNDAYFPFSNLNNAYEEILAGKTRVR